MSEIQRPPLVVAYGMGVDSTAMLVGLHRRGERPDLILFANTGGEKRETYAYLPVINAWLRSVDFPEVTVVQRKVMQRAKHAPYTTLEGNCISNATLPSLAFGFKSCSPKWKREPQDAFCHQHAPFRWIFAQPAQKDHKSDLRLQAGVKHKKKDRDLLGEWKRLPVQLAPRDPGIRITKLIGYDAGPADSKRAINLTDDAEYVYRYPLREWGWARERCMAEIAAAGLPVPMKSSCFFCPAMQPAEVRWLVENHPDMADRIVAMETAAAPNLVKIEGLWRNGTKGTRGGQARPGKMSTFIATVRAELAQGSQSAA